MCLAPRFISTRQARYRKNIEGFVRQPAGLDGSCKDFGEGTIKCVHGSLRLVVSGFVSMLYTCGYMFLFCDLQMQFSAPSCSAGFSVRLILHQERDGLDCCTPPPVGPSAKFLLGRARCQAGWHLTDHWRKSVLACVMLVAACTYQRLYTVFKKQKVAHCELWSF